MNAKIAAAKKFVVAHKTAIAVAATAVICYKMHSGVVKEWNTFLDEHGLTDLYYRPEE